MEGWALELDLELALAERIQYKGPDLSVLVLSLSEVCLHHGNKPGFAS